jgi:NADH-quinone oxidoreductase subunit J
MMWFEELVFYLTAIVLISSGLMVIIIRNPVHAALFLILAFFASAVLWILLSAEFLALILILVYVGAVMTLFLFVVMMLNLDVAPFREGFVNYLPFGILLAGLMGVGIIYVVGPEHFGLRENPIPPVKPANFSNVSALGEVLYTYYVYPFELGSILLLTAIVAAISLSLRKARAKKQNIAEQLRVEKKKQVRLVMLTAEKKVSEE